MLLVEIKYTYIDPTLAPYYKDEFSAGEDKTGVYFMFAGLGCLLGGLLTPVLASKPFPLRTPLIVGNLTSGVTAFFLAPVTHRGTLISSVFFLYVGAIFDSLISGPIVALMNAAVEHEYPKEQQDTLRGYILSVNAFTNSVGQFLGPIIGSLMAAVFGFRWTCGLLGALIFGVAIVHHALVDICTIVTKGTY